MPPEPPPNQLLAAAFAPTRRIWNSQTDRQLYMLMLDMASCMITLLGTVEALLGSNLDPETKDKVRTEVATFRSQFGQVIEAMKAFPPVAGDVG